MKFRTNSAEETVSLGAKIGSYLQKGDIIALQGTLAAGKTTITKGIARALGVAETITSPTFCLISEYNGKMPLYHFDVYRLQGSDDFANLGAEDMLYGNGICLIEWSEKIMDELPKRTIVVKLETLSRSSDASVAEGEQDNNFQLRNRREATEQEHDSGSTREITIENWPYEEFGGEE